MLLVLGSRIVWQIYVWLDGVLGSSRPSFHWVVGIFYFALWMWLFLLLMNEGRRFSGIAADSLFGGCLLAVAVVLHKSDVLSALSRTGFGAAWWIALFGACGFVLSKCANMYRMGKATDTTSTKSNVG
jgi:hypothetical protein